MNRRRAFSLIEAMTVMVCLGIALSLGAVALIAAMRSNQIAAGTLLQTRLRVEAADAFRADVAGAVALPNSAGTYARGRSCLILKKPDGEHVIYEWRERQLSRIVRDAHGESKTIFQLSNEITDIEFTATGDERPIVALATTAPYGRESLLLAALGGDLR